YPGAEIAAQQRAAYPDIRSIILPVTPGIAFDSALKVVRSMGWRIIEADATAGRIQASATTFWFGFTDDVVVRIISAAGGCKVDVRSVSRVGRSDLGTNAKRIRTFLRKLERASMTDTTYRMGQRSFAFASHTRKESIGQ
ncbi:MAG TPA: DUF1499 domain-containing protein, partial [Nitrospirota bacterium]|nr:DUF1499 domain-containing protein [Nitrospirota bacterium]